MYESLEDLPIVCQLNLPEDALQVYRDEFNRAWRGTSRYRAAQDHAWREVKKRFQRDERTGRWVRRK